MTSPTKEPLKILLGVTGGIAAYKSPDLVRKLTARGCEVQVVLTRSAARFVAPLTFEAVSGRRVRDDLWDEEAEAAMGHIELARWADYVLVAPATAHFIGALAAGLAGDLLTTLCIATAAPVALAPAMNRQMWAHAAVQANCRLLENRGVRLIGPGAGEQACGEHGMGRMLEPEQIVAALLAVPPPPVRVEPADASRASSESSAASRASVPDAAAPRPSADVAMTPGRLAGLKVVITAGPTREPIDPVRYITNRSSGRMGFAVASAARAAGAEVVLVSGPVALETPPGVRRIDVETAEQMYARVHEEIPGTDLFIACAAVADYRPEHEATEKIKRTEPAMHLDLIRSPDTLASVAALPNPPFTVGFAAETHNVVQYAREKLVRKRVDMIAANRVGPDCGFDRDTNELVVYWQGGEMRLGEGAKAVLARRLMEIIADRYFEARKTSTVGAQ